MAAVCEIEHFKERIEAKPENRDVLMRMDVGRFVAVMTHWREYFVRGADLPVIGATEEDLKSIRVPACVVPGNDNTHPRQVGENLCRLLSDAELHLLMTQHYDMDLSPREEWDAKEGEMAAVFVDFMKRASARSAA
jgi:hypothetical protein